MIEGFLPGWVGDAADLLSMVSVPVTFYLGYQAKSIKGYFFNRIRIGETIPVLSQEATELLRALGDWKSDSGRTSRLVISRIKGHLHNIKLKLGADERKSVSQLLVKIDNRRFYFFGRSITDVTEDQAWEIASDYAAIITRIQGGHKDATWRQQ